MSTRPPANEPMEPQRLTDLVIFVYRSLVVRHRGRTAEWRVLEWTDAAEGNEATLVTQQTGCRVMAQYLAPAPASDDGAEWRRRQHEVDPGVNRTDRQQLWAGLEQTYRDVELMQFDIGRLAIAP